MYSYEEALLAAKSGPWSKKCWTLCRLFANPPVLGNSQTPSTHQRKDIMIFRSTNHPRDVEVGPVDA